MQRVQLRLDLIARHPFRAKFHLHGRERVTAELSDPATMRLHAYDLVAKRLAPAEPAKDGRQTPYRGHPVFVEASVVALRALKDLGVRITIDDFGTGYSSLSYLKKFPIDTIKIDQAFVRDVSSDANDAAIVRAAIVMAHELKLNVIAEGVETAEQVAFLRRRHCTEMQGYLFSEPVTADRFGEILDSGTTYEVRPAG